MIVVAEEPFYECLGGLNVFSVLERGYTFGYPGDTIGRIDNGNIVVFGQLFNAGVNIGDADGKLVSGDLVLRVGTTAAVVSNVLVQLFKVIPAGIALGLQQSIDHGVVGAGHGGVGHYDFALILFLGQIVPGSGLIELQLFEQAIVYKEANDSDALGVPVTVRIAEFRSEIVGGIEHNGFEQAVVSSAHESIDSAAKPQIGGRSAALSAELGEHFTGGHGQNFNGNAGVLGELFKQGAVNVAGSNDLHRSGEFGLFGFGGSDNFRSGFSNRCFGGNRSLGRIGLSIDFLLGAANRKAKSHHKHEQKCSDFLH